MKLFVGLGNPGAKYSRNRHNIGFMALEEIAGRHGFGPWKGKFYGALTQGVIAGQKIILLKPETFMNRSGQSVGEAMRFYKLSPQDVTVFHDELDLAPGKLRCKSGGGHAGHNGLRSIHQHIGPEYHRVRLGIGHPGRKELVAHYVLSDFAKSDGDWLEEVLDGIARGFGDLAGGDTGGFQNKVAQARQATKKPAQKAGKAAQEGGLSRKGKTVRDRSELPKSKQDTSAQAGQMPDTRVSKSPAEKTAATDKTSAPETLSPLQRLMAKFNK